MGGLLQISLEQDSFIHLNSINNSQFLFQRIVSFHYDLRLRRVTILMNGKE